ncbi:MAG: MBOAT family protein [Muribaculaceae bacterium]|nr:MBOAT family protein [Muribaculaceae bacterium]
MLFNSIEFILFLPVVFLIYWAIKPLKWQNAFVIVASYVFYGWWDWRFLGLIFLATTTSFICGILLERFHDKMKRKAVVWANVIVSLGILGTYKYYNFFAENFSNLMSLVGIETGFVTLQLVLPVGISFYTFQTLSYTIDVYRGTLRPTRDPFAFYAFISFFPQLVAGPIERADNLLPQFLKRRTFDYDKAINGLRQALWGFFKKIVIADNCGITVDRVFENYQDVGSVNLFVAAVLFSIQIYCDFSGYTDIAIGTSRLFGVGLRRNFNFPYFSRDIAEFWRRWHISLSTWFRDYVYIPLGGNRKSRNVTIRNTIIVFMVSGFWHGADWTFISWGAFNAMLFIPLLMAGKSRRFKGSTVAENSFLPSVKETLMMAVTFLLVVIGRILYRAKTIPDAWHFFKRMVTKFTITKPLIDKSLIPLIIFLFIMEWVYRKKQFGLDITGNGLMKYRAVRWGFYYILTMMILLQTSRHEAFIYFQF